MRNTIAGAAIMVAGIFVGIQFGKQMARKDVR